MIRQLVVIFLFSLSLNQSWAQVDLSYQLGKDSIFIGDQVNLQIQLKLEPGVEITAIDFSPWDSIPVLLDVDALLKGDTNPPPRMAGEDFEIVDYGLWSGLSANKRILAKDLKWNTGPNNELNNTIKFTLWKEGVFALPQFFIYYSQQNQEKVFSTQEGLILTVFSPLFTIKEPLDSLQLAEVKPILEEAKNIEDYLLYIISGLVFLLAFGIGYFYLKRKANQEAPPAPPRQIPAHEYALQELKALEESKLWQQGEIKTYQSKLTYILRAYLEHRYDIPALESTTDNLLWQLKKENFDSEQKESLRNILQVADLVKFAKAKPAVDIHTKVMSDAESFVRNTKAASVNIAIHADGEITKVKEPTEEELNINPLDVQENLAGISERALANLIDLPIIGLSLYLPWVLLDWLAGDIGGSTSFMIFKLLLIVFTLLSYFPFFESKFGGTPGKLFLGIGIRNLDNTAISFWQGLQRLGMKSKDLELLFSVFGNSQNKNRILPHDKITATRVVKKAKI